jgi:DNA-directed RNA polymerase subunit beta
MDDAFSLLGGDSLLSPTPAAQPVIPDTAEEDMRDFGDATRMRRAVYDRAFDAFSKVEPVSSNTHTLRLTNVQWGDPDRISKKRRKEAILAGRTLDRRLHGTWELVDNANGKVIDSRRLVVARIPHVTRSGTFVHRGNEYGLSNQQRLRAGVFTRVKDNGEIEAHANILKNGPSHRYFMDPEKGVFFMRVGQSKIPLMPLLKAMGTTDDEMRSAWGDDLFATNYQHNDPAKLKGLQERLLRPKDVEAADGNKQKALVEAFERMELDPEVTSRTLGQPFTSMGKDTILATTAKLLAVSRDEAEVDDRDRLAYQTFLGPEDLISERIAKDRGSLRRQLLWKMGRKGSLETMPSSALQAQVNAAILESGLGNALEEINPAEIFDKQTRISRLGEGGIPSLQAVPEEARSVQPSHMGFMDPIRTPESFRVGVDVHMARNVRKGSDGRIYGKFVDAKTGKEVWKTPQQAADSAIAFPGAMEYDTPRIPAMKSGRIQWVPRKEVDFTLPSFEYAFSSLGNLVPMKSMVKGQRLAMGSRFITQALPLSKPEAPLVQTAVPDTDGQRSFEEDYASKMGAIHAKQGGVVLRSVTGDMKVKYDDGTTDTVELYDNHPYNRKTFLHQTPMLQAGERFGPGDLLARSNYTDEKGATALGLNARVAYMPWGGKNFEDAIVISESMAERMTSEHMYQFDTEKTDRTRMGRNAYVSLFPGRYSKEIMGRMDSDGVVKAGSTVSFGDPLILSAEQKSRAENKVHRKRQAGFTDNSVVWNHHDDGVVTDVVKTRKGPVVLVKSKHPMQVGDKLAGRHGDKGVIGAIIPDHQMPHDKEGIPFEVLLNPLGTQSRVNPAQHAEAALGKLAYHRGRPFKVEDFREDIDDYTEWAIDQLRRAGLSDTEDVTDPATDRKISGISTGRRFFMKLHHMAESKGQGRGSGGYTSEDAPAKGGETGSKRVSMMDVNALLSHGATEVIRDAAAVRGQRNEDYWLQFMQGVTPRQPKVPMVYQKFVDSLKGAGINVVREGAQLNIMALTDDDVSELAGNRLIRSGETVSFGENLTPVPGGLFDKELTGGHHGTRWSAIKLAEPMPNPVMEEPIRRVLGLTQKKFEGVLEGTEELPRYGSGPKAIATALDKLDLDKELMVARVAVSQGTKSARDQAVRRLGYLKSAKRMGLHPRQWVLQKAPVLPPQFRPINVMGTKDIPLVADANFLYKELVEANNNLREMASAAGEEGSGAERLAVYRAFKAVTGLGDPVTQQSQEKKVRGILKGIFGSSPKYGTVQRKLLSSTVDNVGRAVITPNPDLDMDSVGLPEDRAFEVYKRFIVRRLKRKGMQMTQAMRHVREQTPLARQILVEEMDERPIIINRAPVMHRFGIMAFKPQLVRGSTLQVSPLIVKGFNADFDGDAMNYHVPTDEAAKKEALDRMLPSRQLLSPSDFRSPVHVPSMEYVGGLYTASTSRSKRAVRTFRNQKDVMAAWKRGEIGIDDQIKILE